MDPTIFCVPVNSFSVSQDTSPYIVKITFILLDPTCSIGFMQHHHFQPIKLESSRETQLGNLLQWGYFSTKLHGLLERKIPTWQLAVLGLLFNQVGDKKADQCDHVRPLLLSSNPSLFFPNFTTVQLFIFEKWSKRKPSSPFSIISFPFHALLSLSMVLT